MENTKRNFGEHGMRGRFFGWARSKMTGADAFGIMFGDKGKECPEEMQDEFVALFDRLEESHARLHADRGAFVEKWKEYMPEGRELPNDDRFGGAHPFGRGREACQGHGEGFHGRGRGFFGW